MPRKEKPYDDESLDDKIFGHNPIYYYPKIREVVIKTLGDGLRNLAPKRKEKLIQRGVLLYMKGTNAVINNALEAIHFPEKNSTPSSEQNQEK